MPPPHDTTCHVAVPAPDSANDETPNTVRRESTKLLPVASFSVDSSPLGADILHHTELEGQSRECANY